MVSQPEGGGDVYECASFIRGLHAHEHIWQPRVGEVLILKREPENSHDKFAVAVVKSDSVVGHVPYEIASVISHFLKRDFNKGTAEITGCRSGPRSTVCLPPLRTASVRQKSQGSD